MSSTGTYNSFAATSSIPSRAAHTLTNTKDFIQDAVKLISAPPGLPSGAPTAAAWQNPPHPAVSTAQSPKLASETDIIIIGSGITGIGASHCLLHHPQAAHLRVTMLEARTAMSGATGRNGGHLVSDSDSLFSILAKTFGIEKAAETVRFSEANIRRLKELIGELDAADRDAVEFRTVATATAFSDQESFEEAQDCLKQLLEAVPDGDLTYEVLGKEAATKKFGFGQVAGAIVQHGVGALWPYRLLTAVLASLRKRFPERFALETNTPVLSIQKYQDRYELRTPRGSIRAKHVIHCTNGYSGRLIPGLAGSLYPLKGTMSTQAMGPSFPNLGDRLSWSHVARGTFDAKSGHIHLGLYYAQQNAKTGVMFLGGESQKLSHLLTGNDSFVASEARETLTSAAPTIWKDAAPAKPLQVWSGIMGFTADGMPIVGNLPERLTGRAGSGEWIAAGFNGHGMDKAWLSGEAIAKMVLGERHVDGFPRAYLLSAERAASWTPEKAAETLMDHVMLGSDAPTSRL